MHAGPDHLWMVNSSSHCLNSLQIADKLPMLRGQTKRCLQAKPTLYVIVPLAKGQSPQVTLQKI